MESNAASLAASYAVRLLGGRSGDSGNWVPGPHQAAPDGCRPAAAQPDATGPETAMTVSGLVRRYFSRARKSRRA
jgi:hypothetical protein